MATSAAFKDAVANHAGTILSYVAAHSADPGSAGTGSPEIETAGRQALTWAASSGGVVTASDTPTLAIPANGDVAFLSVWTAATGGTFQGSQDVRTNGLPEHFNSAGQYQVTPATFTES